MTSDAIAVSQECVFGARHQFGQEPWHSNEAECLCDSRPCDWAWEMTCGRSPQREGSTAVLQRAKQLTRRLSLSSLQFEPDCSHSYSIPQLLLELTLAQVLSGEALMFSS
jgi:hypothetical protein